MTFLVSAGAGRRGGGAGAARGRRGAEAAHPNPPAGLPLTEFHFFTSCSPSRLLDHEGRVGTTGLSYVSPYRIMTGSDWVLVPGNSFSPLFTNVSKLDILDEIRSFFFLPRFSENPFNVSTRGTRRKKNCERRKKALL